jgi:hypothetical protein
MGGAMNTTCNCGKGYASQYDNLCRFCREHLFSRADCKAVGVRHLGDGLAINQAWSIWDKHHLPTPVAKAAEAAKNAHVFCPYCGNPAKLVPGSDIYCHRKDLYDKWFWECLPCEAHVGVHLGSKGFQPYGGLAKADLRKARKAAHVTFDAIWKDGRISRSAAYLLLCQLFDLPLDKCHIGMFNMEQCSKVIQAANLYISELNKVSV